MPEAAWKQWENRVAKGTGGRRRGPDFRGPDGGKDDVIHEHYSIECKLLSRPSYGDLLSAARKAEAQAQEGQEPIAVVKRRGRGYTDADALVVMRWETWCEWHGA